MTAPERPERRPVGGSPRGLPSGSPRGPIRPTRGHEALDRPTGTPVVPDALRVTRRPVVAGTGPPGGRLGRAAERLWRTVRRLLERDAVVLVGLLALAAAVQFAGLETRGRFDGDQGHDVLVLLRLVRDGSLPLLGPPTSIGDFHHGAAYYYLLAPAAWLSSADPTAIVAWIAVLGVAAVGATWWFARLVGGPVAAAIAGLLMAVSPSAIEESTFIWNPNPIPLFAAIALGCAWKAHAGPAPRWWIPAIVAAGMVLQLHVLGIVFLPPILGLAVVDVVGARRSGDTPRGWAVVRGVAAGLGLAALLFVPLLINELSSGFEETRRILEFLAGGSGEAGFDPLGRLAITLFRVIGWPLVGLVTAAPAGAVIVVTAATVLSGWLMLAGRGSAGTVARWLGLSLIWSGLALAVLAPSLQTVVIALPNDHYHTFMDPVVFVLVALAARSLAVDRGPRQGADVAARSVVAVALVGLVILDVGLWPPPDPNGGWPKARAAGERIVEVAGSPVDVRQLPIFKTAEGVGFPVIAAGGRASMATGRELALRPIAPDALIVVACDRLFEDIIGNACGGAAETSYLRQLSGSSSVPDIVTRFPLSPRIVISIYKP